MSEKRSKKTETKRKAAKRRRRSLALSVMVGILLAGVENCLFLPYGSNYAAESEKRLSVSEGQVGCETEMESELKWNLEPESESEYCLEAESESESEAESESESEAESESGSEAESESESEAESESESEAESDSESETESESESEIKSESEPETESESGRGTEPENESEMESWMGTEPQRNDETRVEVQVQSENETEREETENLMDQKESEAGGPGESAAEKAEQLERGIHYEVTGDADSWYRDTNGLLWIKVGTSVYVNPISDSDYNIGSSLENLTEDGVFSFTLKRIEEDGTKEKESAILEENYYVDGEAPSARFQISGSQLSEITYASGSCTVSLSVEPDGKSGLKGTSYKILPCDLNGSVPESAESLAWTDCGSSTSVSVSEEGLFRIYVKTVDMVGNVAYSRSNIICVDRTAPMITITGVEDQTANSGSVCLSVNCTDSWYKTGSMQVSISGANQGNAPSRKESGSSGSGAWIEYCDFPKLQSYDDVYTVSVTAEDLAGNISEKSIQFSINRFGSAYDLSRETRILLDQYFLPEACDVVFYETNIDYVGESAIYCRHDGILRELTAGVDYQVSMEGNESTWKRYCYTVSAEYFSREGVYELLLVSQDAAQNQSDTGMQQKRVTFVIDWSIPTCTVSGIESGGIYESEAVSVLVVPNDNLGLNSLRIYHNSELLMENNNQPISGEAVKITLKSSQEWQTLQVWLCDMAGNEFWSEEIPVFISTEGENIPAYTKVRKSAMELADETTGLQDSDKAEENEKLLNEENEMEPLEDDSERRELVQNGGSDNSDASELSAGAASDTQYSSENRVTSEKGGFLAKNSDKRTGWIVLIIGMLIFSVTTASVCPIFGKRFK